MKVDAVGKVGEAVTEANVPVLDAGEKTIGFRELEYSFLRGALFKKTLVPWRKGWVYQTNKRVICLDDGWEDLGGGARGKRMHEVAFDEVLRVEHRKREVLIHIATAEGKYTAAFRPFGASARLFDWLSKEKERRVVLEKGEAESPYRKSREETG